MPEKQAGSLTLALVLTSSMTNHNIATSAKHPLSRATGGRDTEVFFVQLADLQSVDLTSVVPQGTSLSVCCWSL